MTRELIFVYLIVSSFGTALAKEIPNELLCEEITTEIPILSQEYQELISTSELMELRSMVGLSADPFMGYDPDGDLYNALMDMEKKHLEIPLAQKYLNSRERRNEIFTRIFLLGRELHEKCREWLDLYFARVGSKSN